MDREKYITNILEKSGIWNDGRRYYKEKPFTHFVWNLYHPDDPIKEDEVIHHKNEDILDDCIDNLEKMKKGDHSFLHNFGSKRIEESRKKMSKAHQGKKHTEESRKKISKALTDSNHPMYGKKHTKETREKISRSKTGSNHPMYGKKISDETRKKISKAQTGKKLSEETKRKISMSMLHRGRELKA